MAAVFLVLLIFISRAINPGKKPAPPPLPFDVVRKQREMDREAMERMKVNTLKHEAEYFKQHPYHDTMTNEWFQNGKDGQAGLDAQRNVKNK